MKRSTWKCALAVLLLGVANAGATDFDGWYLGINAGQNKSSATALADKDTGYLGLAAGYNWDMQTFLLGVDAFADTHSSGHSGQDAGLDVKLGLPLEAWLPYAKLGLAGTSPGTRFHGGLGVEYKFAARWSAYGEWMTDKKSSGATDYKNTNLLVGLNYYFGGGRAAASDAAARDAAAREAAARDAAARDAAARDAAARDAAARDAAARDAAARESWKTSIIEKPVRLEGASFASGSSRLLPGAGEKLDEVVNAARQFPDIQLQVMGYTDNVGNAQGNLRLSQDRADAVRAYLVGKGVSSERITSKGFGADNPIADNATAEGRAKNRRVEIRYTVKEEKKVRVTE